MAIAHDLAESVTGDLSLGASRLLPAGAKASPRKPRWMNCWPGCGFAGEWQALWQEFEEQETAEAKLVRDADRLDLLAHGLSYERVVRHARIGGVLAVRARVGVRLRGEPGAGAGAAGAEAGGRPVNLYAVMLGGTAPGASTELHDVGFAIGETIESTYEQLMGQWFGSLSGLHIDSWLLLDVVDGHRVSAPEARAGPARLWCVNLGAYRRDRRRTARSRLPGRGNRRRSRGARAGHVLDRHRRAAHRRPARGG